MANVTVAGASYQDVPAVQLPLTGGGVAMFYEGIDGDNIGYGVSGSSLVGMAQVGISVVGGE